MTTSPAPKRPRPQPRYPQHIAVALSTADQQAIERVRTDLKQRHKVEVNRSEFIRSAIDRLIHYYDSGQGDLRVAASLVSAKTRASLKEVV